MLLGVNMYFIVSFIGTVVILKFRTYSRFEGADNFEIQLGKPKYKLDLGCPIVSSFKKFHHPKFNTKMKFAIDFNENVGHFCDGIANWLMDVA